MLANTFKFCIALVTLVSLKSEISSYSYESDFSGLEQVVNDKNNDERVFYDSTEKANNSEPFTGVDSDDEESDEKITEDQKSHEDTHESISKFQEIHKPLWKIKDTLGKRQEPGFDFTPEEMVKLKLWKGGVIPYFIDNVSYGDKTIRDRIRNYLHRVNSISGLNFIEVPGPPADDNQRWVMFVNRRGLLGCADHSVKNFTHQGVQKVVLGYDCIETRGEMAEAVMSIAGVPAQHNAPDRDNYIQVNMENIVPDKQYLFEKMNDDEWLFHDLDYDFSSITHYDLFKYSANGRPSLVPKNESVDLGVAKELSPIDLLKVRMLYNYIAKTAPMERSQCAKLFMARSKFERFIPHTILIRPRKKPARYLDPLDSSRKGKNTENIIKLQLAQLNDSIDQGDVNKYNTDTIMNSEISSKEENINTYEVSDYVTKPKHNLKVVKKHALEVLSDYISE